ncbi:SubName: Full=Uncharacterized protein {ECO:0000313/EMBL:CCA70785.1} [Serendipita indica DSM 11827]|uniref:Uncharacterized protein n=1 Tax=Serendipita indica (strain DSM 11827) TaxID=1109443 RepID=G4THI8_SERID|nr:SubName: Full=Uncharacterized protein {ECO:0000313/EMBL:CCA70785.1} [Serendipita indica DSM 11827]CCA70785.1 hypothetical protein PIIN_04720 [Serendipita indica DSM 11827]
MASTLQPTVLVTSISTTIPLTTSLPPFASTSQTVYVECFSSASGTCASSSTLTAVAIFDYFFGLNLTTTVTTVIPVTITTEYAAPTATTPCSKQQFERCNKAGRTLKLSNPSSILVVLLLAVFVLM